MFALRWIPNMFLWIGICQVVRCQGDQQSIDYLASFLQVRYDVIDNLMYGASGFLAQINFTNVGPKPISKGHWSIYLCHINMIEPNHLPNPNGYILGNSSLRAFHVNGCLFKLTPTDSFKTLFPGKSIMVPFKAANWQVARTDIMPNWYVASSKSGILPKVLKSTAGESLSFVGPFNTPQKWKRYSFDVYNPYTPEQRYHINSEVRDLGSAGTSIVPSPVEMVADESKMVDLGTGDWVLFADPAFKNEVAFLTARLHLRIVPRPASSKCIAFTQGQVLIKGRVSKSSEAYTLHVFETNQTIRIVAAGPAGAFYGIHSILSLLTSNNSIPKVAISDEPRYEFRGFSIDLSRNFHPVQDIRQLLDLLARYKMNRLHLHVTDDEGWRLQIPGLDELTAVGSKRCHTLDERTCILPQLGSLPNGTGSGSGHYTVKDYKSLILYAKARHISVHPEFDMPGHAHAAIKATQARYYNKLAQNASVAEASKFLLSELNDTSRYLSVQHFTDDAVNPCINSTLTFIKFLVKSTLDLHAPYQLLKSFHYGGDEVSTGAWVNSSACRPLLPSPNPTPEEVKRFLKKLLLKAVSNITARYGIYLYAWEDGLMSDTDTPYPRSILFNKQVIADVWQNIWEWGVANRAYKLANAGYQVRYDVIDNLRYVASSKSGILPKVLKSTAGESLSFVGPFNTPQKWKRYSFDVYNPYTPEQRYHINSEVRDLGSAGTSIVPSPVEMVADESKMVDLGTGDWVLFADPAFKNEVAFLTARLHLRIVPKPASSKCIALTQGQVLLKGRVSKSSEAYTLHVFETNQTIRIVAAGPAGAFYGIQSILSLLTSNNKIPKVAISDEPRYGFRGFSIDLSRNFHPVQDIRQLLDLLARYKMNRLHLHVTDDEGWRLQIPGLDELTAVGSKRCHTLDERTCILPQLGSLPNGTGSGSGHYTVKDYKSLILYAKARHISVHPEFDMPGHAHAAIKATQARYYNKLAQNASVAEASKFLLSELNDTSRYLSVQHFTDDAVNPCINSTLTFIKFLVKSTLDLHAPYQLLKSFHYGGDEVSTGAWVNSSACRPLLPSSNPTPEEVKRFLKKLLLKAVSNITARYGIYLYAWEDGLMSDTDTPYPRSILFNKQVIADVWQNIWEWGVANRAYKLANAGYQVVMSQATHLYFDHPQELDPEERGFYWATRFTDTKKVFGFLPDNLYANADFKRSGEPITEKELCKTGQCVPLQKPENILGMQGNIWSETVRTSGHLHEMLFPRVVALAERAWHKARWESITDKASRDQEMLKDWERFANVLGYKELPRLEYFGVKHYLPLPGARIKDKTLEANIAFPGYQVQYSDDKSKTWKDYSQPVQLNNIGPIYLRSRSKNGRTSRWIILKS
ncbi:uncharacterized protein LOC106178458 [Lingula anatina]|uniref:beta-N-acetylhexosaminidase n=1 Tax=Lingula anatina TaxID=7574 RepID=A0A1S3K393_LINAN|nr:uncharacterized protein LOC106178458 [Lingula anatina]|eukprot:XP_013417098.1 uncharacterized protein LOC106178458 [Lingula anatina]